MPEPKGHDCVLGVTWNCPMGADYVYEGDKKVFSTKDKVNTDWFNNCPWCGKKLKKPSKSNIKLLTDRK